MYACIIIMDLTNVALKIQQYFQCLFMRIIKLHFNRIKKCIILFPLIYANIESFSHKLTPILIVLHPTPVIKGCMHLYTHTHS